MGFFPGIKAFCAAVLGGIGNVPGAMLGGFFLGVVESVGPALFLDGDRHHGRPISSGISSPSPCWSWCSSSARRESSASGSRRSSA